MGDSELIDVVSIGRMTYRVDIANKILGALFIIVTAVGGALSMSIPANVPPIPILWLIGLILLILGVSVVVVSAILLLLEDIRKLPAADKTWLHGVCVFGAVVLISGVFSVSYAHLEYVPCPCDTDFYLNADVCVACPPCSNHSTGCNKLGRCECEIGWAGHLCDECANGFTGANCDRCTRSRVGELCDQCANGYAGNCDECASGFIHDSDLDGLLCNRCKPGHYGPYCKSCPNCTIHDTLATCKDNDWFENNVYDPQVCTQVAQTCSSKYDCSSFNCKGQCTAGDVTDDLLCESDEDCRFGWSCKYKSCCAEARYGDGTCSCGKTGFWGPLCETCPGYDGVYSSTVCGGNGVCVAAYTGAHNKESYSHLRCECNTDGDSLWTGATCGCFKNSIADTTCSKCQDGYYGESCQACQGGGGIRQCNMHGRCNDTLQGDGTCTCDVDIKHGGLGGWGGSSCSNCYSNDFYGDSCRVCPGTQVVSCSNTNDGSFLATLPNTGNCIDSCIGTGTCNVHTGVCS